MEPTTMEWDSAIGIRIPIVVDLLKKAGKFEGWLKPTNQGSIVELLANHIGPKGRHKDSCRKAFSLFLSGDLEGHKQDDGKALSSAFVFAVMLGRMPNSSGRVPSVGNKVNGVYMKPAGFERQNPDLYRCLNRLVVDTGGIFTPQAASTTVTRNIKRVALADIQKGIMEDAEVIARIENYAMDRRPRTLPTPQSEAPLLLAHKESAKERKARKQRERRAAIKAAKLTK